MPHQVTDSGLDETSCFFIDDDGEKVPHGHYYEQLALRIPSTSEAPTVSPTTSAMLALTPPPTTSSPISEDPLSTPSPTSSPTTNAENIFEGGDFSSYPDRRKVSHSRSRISVSVRPDLFFSSIVLYGIL